MINYGRRTLICLGGGGHIASKMRPRETPHQSRVESKKNTQIRNESYALHQERNMFRGQLV